ncbi:MAG: hypothetical protein QOG43_3642 [Actinomycetota bacterium]|jgi:hypothetical protein|nr:hypothetical protein [Actinomycetota bacterium]
MQRPRLCARPGCGEAATASLTFQYATSTVWLDDLGVKEPHSIDLCGRHADRLAAPKGWTGHDRRAARRRAAADEGSPAAGTADAGGLRAQAS